MTHPLVQAARKYIGVRWRHRGRTKWSLDCAGLVIRAYADCGITLPDRHLYGREPHNDGLIESITVALGKPAGVAPVALSDLQIGDVIVIRFAVQPHHVLLVADCAYDTASLNAIQASGEAGRVIEHRIDESIAQQITHVFRRPV